MKLYRLTRQKYAADLSGEGAKLYGGRWNSKGKPMLYTATARSLAILELLVNTDKRFIPADMVMITLEVDESLISEHTKLPKNWREVPAPRASQKWGDTWLAKNELGVFVPSVIVPQEQNVLLNPQNTTYTSDLKIIETVSFSFDKRMF